MSIIGKYSQTGERVIGPLQPPRRGFSREIRTRLLETFRAAARRRISKSLVPSGTPRDTKGSANVGTTFTNAGARRDAGARYAGSTLQPARRPAVHRCADLARTVLAASWTRGRSSGATYPRRRARPPTGPGITSLVDITCIDFARPRIGAALIQSDSRSPRSAPRRHLPRDGVDIGQASVGDRDDEVVDVT